MTEERYSDESPLRAFGRMLREKREDAGRGIREISDRTKIPIHVLEALENGNREKLPADVFIKGFLRAIAREIGLPTETLVEEYPGAGRPGPQKVAVPITARNRMNRNAMIWTSALMIVLILGAVVGGGYLLWPHVKNLSVFETPADEPDAAPTTVAATDEEEPDTGLLGPGTTVSGDPTPDDEPLPGLEGASGPEEIGPSQPGDSPPPDEAAEPGPDLEPEPGTEPGEMAEPAFEEEALSPPGPGEGDEAVPSAGPGEADEAAPPDEPGETVVAAGDDRAPEEAVAPPPEPEVAPEPEPEPEPEPVPPPDQWLSGGNELKLIFDDESWVQVTVDDNPTEHGLYGGGVTKSWTPLNKISLVVGNAGAVTVVLNGNDLGPLGTEGKVGRLILPR